MHIVHSIAGFRYIDGGPPRSVGQLCDCLAESRSHSIRLLFGESDSSSRARISRNVICTTVPFIHRYNERPFSSGGFKDALSEIHTENPISVVHQHGIWLKSNHETARFAHKNHLPHIIAPRGMLEPWAMRNSSFKKKLFWYLHQHKDLSLASGFHATALEEAKNIRKLGFKQPIAVIPNGVEIRSEVQRTPKSGSELKVALFVSRIHPKKGLLMLLSAWKKLSPRGWCLRIVGNDEDNYGRVIEAEIRKLQLDNDVTLVGPLYDEGKELAFQQADLFILPSYSENFGIVVAEALGYSLPVLTTTGCPWGELVDENCGWWVNPDEESIQDGLTKALSTPSVELISMGKRGRSLVERRYLWRAICENMMSYYSWMSGHGRRGDFVV